jgi:arabinose-5-phosphate isomerase
MHKSECATPKPPHSFVCQTGQDVIVHEAKGLMILAETLDEHFDQAVSLINQTKGRLIVSGVGKSGHVGRKLAATFASTGQPSFFIHAAEASHGDLGMITRDDTLLLLSYSGEALELHSLLNYGRRLQLPVISITSKHESMLARHSNVTLTLPSVGEACPMGLAPTTSTTMTMAMGDALAVSLLTLRGFTKNDFRTFHPGGNLGRQLRSLKDYMHTGDQIPLVHQNVCIAECIDSISKGRFGCTGVYNDAHHLVGIITDGDLRRHLKHNLLEQKAYTVMTRDPVTIGPDALMGDALVLFQEKAITNVFIVDMKNEHNTILGILHLHDCLKGNII